MERTSYFLAAAGFVVLGACNGRVEQVLGAAPGSMNDGGGGGAPDDAPAPAPDDAGPTTPPATPTADGNDCTTDAQCNDDPSPAPLLGRCWRAPESGGGGKGACLCNAGAWIQPSGKCGLAEPSLSCASAGGACSSWVDCSNAGDYRSGAARAHDACAVDGAAEAPVCCLPSSACRKTNVPHCYIKGTDAAYSLPCINGWVTCAPGDSPDIDI